MLPLGALVQSQRMLFHGKELIFNHVLGRVHTELAHLSPGAHPSPACFTFLLLALVAAQEGQFGFEFLRIHSLFLSFMTRESSATKGNVLFHEQEDPLSAVKRSWAQSTCW